jgi:hypothetical protein
MVGIIAANSPDANFSTEGYIGSSYAKSIGYFVCTGGGAVYSTYWSSLQGPALTGADTLGFVLDYNLGTLTAYKNGALFGVLITGINEAVYPAYSVHNFDSNLMFNFGENGFWLTPPTGCTPI